MVSCQRRELYATVVGQCAGTNKSASTGFCRKPAKIVSMSLPVLAERIST